MGYEQRYFIGPLTKFDIYKSNDFSSGTTQPGKERAGHIKYFIIEDVGVPRTKKVGGKECFSSGKTSGSCSNLVPKMVTNKGNTAHSPSCCIKH